MNELYRPTVQPIPARVLLGFFVLLTAILAISTGYNHQRWQNQLKRTVRVQKQLDICTASQSAVLKIDP